MHTDDESIIHLLKQPHLSGRQERWVEKLQEFHIDIKYKAGVGNIVADALSRIPQGNFPVKLPNNVLLEVNAAGLKSDKEDYLKEIREGYQKDEWFVQVVEALKSPEVKQTGRLASKIHRYAWREDLLYMDDTRLCVPKVQDIHYKKC